jgi:hypothetical protein
MRAAPVDDFDERDERPDGAETVAFLRRRYGLDAMPIRRGLLSTSLVVIAVATALGLVVGVSGALLVRAGARTAYDRGPARTKAAVDPARERPAAVAPAPARSVLPPVASPEAVAPETVPRLEVPAERPRAEPRAAGVPKPPPSRSGVTTPGPVSRPPSPESPSSSATAAPPEVAPAPAAPAPWVRRVIPPERDTSEKVEPAPDPRAGTPQVTISPWPVPSYMRRRPQAPATPPAPPTPGPERGSQN